jgi:RHS repeat-associated protein
LAVDLPQMLSDGRVLYVPGVGQWDGQAWTYELPDGLGSVRQLADAQGYLVQRYDYAPFGEALASEGKRTNSLRYTGEQWDNDVGLLYLRARWYDPSVGRFTTRDPFLGLAGLPQTQHPYAYVGNNPINLTDPSGKFAFVPLLVIAGGGAIIGGVASGILYAISHPCENLLNSASFWRAVGAGAVGGFVAGLLPIGGSLGAAIGWGVLGGASSAAASQLFVNLTTPGSSWDDDLIGAAITGGVAGGIFGGVGYGIRVLAGRAGSWLRGPLDDAAQARQRLGLPPRSLSPDDSYTVAVLKADKQEFVGVNGRKTIDFPVNAISRDHAEIDALNQLYGARQSSGITGGTATMVVDRIPCSACNQFGGIRSGVEATGLDLLQVIHPGGVIPITPR